MGKIVCRIKILIAEKETEEGRSISYRDIRDATSISQNALSDLAQGKTTRYYANTLIKLCEYFNCQVGDLLVYVPDEPAGASTRAATDVAGS
jgi:putative transcriptional regulator